jgi:hypothetical protein
VSVTADVVRANQHYTYPDMTKTLMPRGPAGKGKGGKGGKGGKAPAGGGGGGGGAGGGGGGAAAAAGGKAKAGKKEPFVLNVQAGGFRGSQIVVLLGENGTGKTTFIRMLAGLMSSDADDRAREKAMKEAEAAGVEFDREKKYTSVPELTIS